MLIEVLKENALAFVAAWQSELDELVQTGKREFTKLSKKKLKAIKYRS